MIAILFVELPDLQWHYDHVIDSLYMIGTCHFRLDFFFHRDFVVPFFHPLFDPTTPFLAIPLYMTHPVPPAAPPTAPPEPIHPASSDSDPLEMLDSSPSSSSGPNDSYAPVDSDMVIRFLSSKSIYRSLQPMQCTLWPSFGTFTTLGHRLSSFLCFTWSDTR